MVTSSIFMLLLYSPFFKVAQVQGTHCSIPWKKYDLRSFNPPLILRKKTSSFGHGIVLPEDFNNQEVIRVPIGSDLKISCPGGRLKSFLKRKLDDNGIAGITANCNQNGQLFLDGVTQQQRSMDLMGCTKEIAETTQEYDSQKGYPKCGNNPRQPEGDLIKIGFNSYDEIFYSQVEVCFDKNLKRTIWSRHNLHGHNIAASSGDRTSKWKNDILYGDSEWPKLISWNKIYTGAYQKTLLLNKLKKDVIYPSGTSPPAGSGLPKGLFLAKGHLSPNADFVTSAERAATFHYINAVPQWQSDNNGNWAHIVEESVKNLAKEKLTDLTIISGGHRTLQLRNVQTGKDVPIFLVPSKLDKKGVLIPSQVPVPKFIWKVVTNKDKSAGVAFVLINNPYFGLLKPDDPMNVSPTPPEDLCEDVCDKLDSWFIRSNDRKKYTKGYTYCCRVDEIRKHISTIPSEYGNISRLLGEKNSGK